jgi:small-conductance mechanosensitive channel
MDQIYQDVIHFLTGVIPKAIFLAIFGYFTARLVSITLTKTFRRRLTAHQAMLLRRLSFYLVLFIFLASAFQELGFHIGVLLSATGILTVAIGIASQTSMSNIVSGIFIIGEKPFRIGDTIKVNDVQGEVVSIDFLSVKIRTDDHTMVRIPNETLIKTAIMNHSYFPTRRADLNIHFAYKENLDLIKESLFSVAERNPYCLQDPKPTFSIQKLGDSAIHAQFSVWGKREDFSQLKNTIHEEIKKILAEKGVEMPIYNHNLAALVSNQTIN